MWLTVRISAMVSACVEYIGVLVYQPQKCIILSTFTISLGLSERSIISFILNLFILAHQQL